MLIASRSTMFSDDGYKGLKFTALSAGSTVSMVKVGNPPPVSVQYSLNGKDWNLFDIDSTTIILSNINNSVYFAATDAGNQMFLSGVNNVNSYVHFAFTGSVKASGNIMSLLDNTMQQDHFEADFALANTFKDANALVDASDLEFPLSITRYNCYSNMFENCVNLSSIENIELKAAIVQQGAYDEMFFNCISLKKTMKTLPGTTLYYASYQSMFENCSSLTAAPEICATTFMNSGSCSRMFYNCYSIIQPPPELPASSLTLGAYNNMFSNCQSLTSTPQLDKIRFTDAYSLQYMFYGCKSLISASNIILDTINSYACYSMFNGCISLSSMQVLSIAHIIGQYNCTNMFNNCKSLSSISSYLTETTLADYCYNYMFSNCTSLVQAPALPATTLASYCYSYMFYNCTSLTQAPALPAETLVNNCYSGMFSNCTSLTQAPALPAETLANNCYSGMFSNCTSLTQAPALPATTLASYCYSSMFYKCNNLLYINTKMLNWSPANATNNWVYNVAPTGIFKCDSNLSIVYGQNYIPTGWSIAQPFTLYALEANSTVKMVSTSYAPSVSLEYSTDGLNWNAFEVGQTIVTLQNIGDSVQFQAGENENSQFANEYDYNYFQMTGRLSANGNIMSLLDQTMKQNSLISSYTFMKLFNDCSSLVSPPQLHAMTLSENCYREMFRNCSNLTSMPSLPATSLKECSYYYMFASCTSLSTAKSLPATSLAERCYMGMFKYCSSLTSAPALPANDMQEYCYAAMFENCTSLQKAPKLPALQLQKYCYEYMFRNCTSLSSIAVGFNDWQTDVVDSTMNWLDNVSPTGEFIGSEQLSDVRGPSNIPVGWTLKRKAQELTFTAVEANSTVSMEPMGSPDLSIDLLYSLNRSSWQPFIVNSTVVTLPNVGDTVKFKAGSYNYRFSSSTTIGYHFVMTGKIAASGPIGSIMDPQNADVIDVLSTYAFGNLFNGCSSLTEAPEINIRHTTTGAFYKLFCSCDNLVDAPSLDSLSNMTTNTCGYMFVYCSKLKTIPNLTLAPMRSYAYMFRECTSLNEITVSFISSGSAGASNMFRECSNLSSVTASQLTSWTGFTNWLLSVAATGEFYCKHDLPIQYGASYIPSGWNVNYLD